MPSLRAFAALRNYKAPIPFRTSFLLFYPFFTPLAIIALGYRFTPLLKLFIADRRVVILFKIYRQSAR